MDRVSLKFIADLLYIKGDICFQEFDDIMNASEPQDLDNIIDKLIRGDYNVYKRGNGATEDVKEGR